MDLSSENISKFEAWLRGRGREEGTARVYANHLRRSAAEPTITTRLLSSSLSPNTRRTNMAALAAWARFSKDDELRDALRDIRLPPPRRMKAKIPLDMESWRAFIQCVSGGGIRNDAIRHVVLIIAKRGIRCSDVLRMQRKQVTAAVSSNVLVFEGKGRKLSRFSAAPIMEHLKALAAMKSWDRVSDLVSPGTPRSALTRIERAVKRCAKKIDVDNVFPHRFRTTYATQFLKRLQGDPQALIKLQRHMDWESLATAARYADDVNADELDGIGADLTANITR